MQIQRDLAAREGFPEGDPDRVLKILAFHGAWPVAIPATEEVPER